MLGKEYDSVASRAQLSDVLIVVFDIFGFGAGDEEFLLDLEGFFLHVAIRNN
jgi:hypothetical protein